MSSEHVYRNADNAKEVLVWADTSDVAKTRNALAGPEIRAAMQEAGVVGPPKIHAIS